MNVFLGRGLLLSGLLWVVTAGAAVAAEPMGVFGGGMANPNIVFLLLLLGIFGLIFEAATPGIMIPGLLGGLALILALSELRTMPANMSGLALMLLGLALIVLPLFRPRPVVLSWVGVVLFTLGAMWLLSGGGLNADIPVMSGLTLASGLFFHWLVARFEKSRETEPVIGDDVLVGRVAEVLDDFDQKGRVMIDGTSWSAVAKGSFKKGDEVKILAVSDLTLRVEKQ